MLRETTGCMSILYLAPKKFLQTKTKWMWNTNELPDDVFSMFNITAMKIEFLQHKQLSNEILLKTKLRKSYKLNIKWKFLSVYIEKLKSENIFWILADVDLNKIYKVVIEGEILR